MKALKLNVVRVFVAALLAPVSASLLAQSPSPAAQSQSNEGDVTALKAQLAEQQKQIDQLKLALQEQMKMIERVSNAAPAPENRQLALPPNKAPLGEVASTTPFIPPAPTPVAAAPVAAVSSAAQAPNAAAANPCEAVPEGQTPAFIRLGSTCLVPIGFMDLTAVWRDKNAASSLGSNFGSVPYNNVVNGKLSEFRFTPQNSRIGFRFDGDWKGAHFIGYNEFDFLGTSGSNALTVTNGAFVPRLRLYWVNVRKGPWEFLAGQSWSMLTPNRNGISPLPGNLFYSQVIDVNYMAGLTWTRQPGMRVLFHPSNKVTFGFSAENPDQYIGGSAGGSGITLPSATALAGLAGSQLDNAQNIGAGNTVLAAPTLHPDFIAKIAFDPSSRFHAEVAGIERTFKILNPTNLALGQYSTKAGGGVQVGLNAEIVKDFRLITTNYWSDGGGRYLFGQAPDVIVRSDASLSTVHSGGTVDGFEWRTWKNNLLLYGYYGGIYIRRNVALDTNGKFIGYGYPGSPNSQNRAIQEITFGFNQTLWASPRYGAINAMGQYEYLARFPWSVAVGAPEETHDNTIYFNLRYTLPGGMPNF
jgi:hypothetical protein